MYILVRKSIGKGFAVNAAAHASLQCHLKFQGDTEYDQWLESSFKKVVCKVSDEELDKARDAGYYVETTESRLDGKLVAVTFKPREQWPECFNTFRLF
jgi:peptidyl-tRNA hydrolase